jgi:ubiquitin-protein ligase
MGLPECIRVTQADLDTMELSLSIFPDEGPFRGAKIDFNLYIPPAYPHSPPKARILQNVKIRHRAFGQLLMGCVDFPSEF